MIGIALFPSLRLNLLPENVLKCDGVGGEFGDTLTQLLNSHLLLVKVEAEVGLVLDVSLLLNVERSRLRSIKLRGDIVLGVVELFE